MTFKRLYFIPVILSAIAVPIVFFSLQIAFYLYGFDTTLIHADSAHLKESFLAYRVTHYFRISVFYLSAGIDFICFVLSLVALFIPLGIRRTVALTTATLSLLLLFFYWIIHIVSQMSGAVLD